jgi:hypothetical protein
MHVLHRILHRFFEVFIGDLQIVFLSDVAAVANL